VSEDPIGLAGGLNVYAYVGNSPTNGTDPSGLDPTITECVQQVMAAAVWVTEGQAEAYCTSPKVLEGVKNSGSQRWGFATPRNQGQSSNFGNPGMRGGIAGGITGGSGILTPVGNSLGLTPGGGWGGPGGLPNRFQYSQAQKACQKSALKNTANTGVWLFGGGALYRTAFAGVRTITGLATGARAALGQFTAGGMFAAALTVDDWAEFRFIADLVATYPGRRP
jgi:uncharacterized protein RhaS with RHS repeats